MFLSLSNGWAVFWSFLHLIIVREYSLLQTKNSAGRLLLNSEPKLKWLPTFLRRNPLPLMHSLFFFVFDYWSRESFLFHILILIYMHDLYKYIIYKLATPSGIVHWINLDKNFYKWLLCSYKTGHQFIGLLSTVKEKNNNWKHEESAIGAKINILRQTCYLFCDPNICTTLGNFLYFFIDSSAPEKYSEKFNAIQSDQAINEDWNLFIIITNLLGAASTSILIPLINEVIIKLTFFAGKMHSRSFLFRP